ncbi:CLUMA_CG018000, isoform B [Clunio marinus]|uniref:CLUMA_CG018000, isoform B n=2 Tax=Clunio marinus TaxID=568069 RepID=A0A1J1IZ83_9DIPT|nr:CLUMA_CG018000, isoform B [Clunio marinus]
MTVWKNVGEQFIVGIAKNNYKQNDDRPNRLELDVGETLIIVRESANWYYGFKKKNRSLKGIFPKCYIHIVADVEIVRNEYLIKRSQIVDEITTVLKEWHEHFKKFFLNGNSNLKVIREKMLELIKLRAQMLSGNLPVDELKDITLKATSEIDTGNKLLGLDMVVRDDNGNILDINQTSTTQLYHHHVRAATRIRRATSEFNKNRKSKQTNKFSHNLMISVHNFVCKVNEDTELLFTLFDADEMKAITENYLVKWNRQGITPFFSNLRVLFTDLSSMDLLRNKIFLVAYVIRVGAMDTKESESRRVSVASAVLSKRSSTQSQNSSIVNLNDLMRRPYGVAAIDLTPIIKKAEDFKSDNQLSMPFIACEKETMEVTLKKLIVNKDVGKDGSNIWITVELLHGDIKQLKEEYPHLILGNIAHARKMGFPEVIFPGDVRNDLYITLVQGEFSKTGGKSSDKNIEVTVCVCNEKGEPMKDVITQGGGAPMIGEYHSVIYYHDDKPKWNETFKVNLPIDDFVRCHLKFMFKHRSSNESKDKNEKPFAMSYLKLQHDSGTTLQQDKHTLVVYRIDYKKYDSSSFFNYYALPSHTFELLATPKPSAPGFTLLNKDSFVIDINLCSTKLTQDVNLLGLLKWSDNVDRLEESLTQLLCVLPEEIVKFLQDILDALFDILVTNQDPLRYDDLVFQCLLMLIEIVSDKKYQHFQSVLDLYISESFSSTLAYKKLIDVLERHFLNAFNSIEKDPDTISINENDKPSERKLYKTIKNLQYIMKFIIRSRILYANIFDDQDKFSFETRLEELMGWFVQLISMPNPLLRPQGAILKYLHIIASDLMEVYDSLKLSNFIVEIITKIPAGRLTQCKMKCIKDIVESNIFRLPLCRGILLPVFCMQIKDKLESKEEVAECVNIMNNILELLFSENIGPIDNDIRDLMLILLRTIIQSSIAMDRDNPLVGNLVAIMLAIFRNMTESHYKMYVNHFNTRFDLQDFLTEILLVFKELVSKPVFPSDWLDMIMHQNTVILESLKSFSQIIKDKFFDPFEKQVWSNFFHCSIAFLIQPALQLDQFTRNKTSIILTRYCDIRRETAKEICKMWYNLGEHKIIFIPQMVGPLLEMSMIPEPELRKSTIPIFFDMMQCEFVSSKYHSESFGDTKKNISHIKGNYREFEKEMIEKLDILVEGGRGDHEYKDLFNEIMMNLCSKHIALRQDGTIFVNMATKLMERLLEYRFLINDESKENRMSCTVSLLQFYSEVNRKEMYIRYVNKLCDLHMEFENYPEAAFTLKLHSKLLLWDNTQLSPLLRSCRHPHCQTHRHLKEELYKEIIKLFDDGKMWECALEVCKELAQQYEYEVFDYISLSHLHIQMSQFYRKIFSEMRHETEYFRVTFYGFGFPELLRNRTFIYRGKEYEQLPSFSARIINQHPRAELMQTLEKPSDDILNSDGQYIQINKVEPIISEKNKEIQTFSQDKNIAPLIVKYYRTNDVNQFKFSRPFRDVSKNWMSSSDPDNVANLWLERTIMKIEYPMPGILKWFPVESSETFNISPIECAIEMMENINKTLHDLLVEHKNDSALAVSQLTMKIQGVVDAAVNGGTAKYEEAFLTDEYLKMNSNDISFVEKLKNLIAEQIPVLEIAISVHRMKVSNDLLPLHERLEECFRKMQTHIETKYGKRTTDLKFERDPMVVLRKSILSTPQMSADNRLSETSVGSSDSGISRATGPSRQITTAITKVLNFNSPTSFTRQTMGAASQINKKINEKTTPQKRKNSKKIDRETLSLPNSQFYTVTTASMNNMIIPLSQTSFEKGTKDILNNNPSTPSSAIIMPAQNIPVFELTEELTPKRPLRSEAEKEKRLSRTQSLVTTSNVSTSKIDNASMSGESSNSRNSIITTDSQTSEEDLVPPPLPIKHRDSEYGNVHEDSKFTKVKVLDDLTTESFLVSSDQPRKGIVAAANNHYEILSLKSRDVVSPDEVKSSKKNPPAPPPKPTRASKESFSP